MKISQLISVLKDIKKLHGDKYIWSTDGLEFPLPSDFEIELVSKLKRTDYGVQGGKATAAKLIEVSIEYEGGVDLVYRSIESVRNR